MQVSRLEKARDELNIDFGRLQLEQATWTIGEGEYFLMGDHRSNSTDSRTFGTVATDRIIGRAWLRYWPIDTFGVLPTPTYPELSGSALLTSP